MDERIPKITIVILNWNGWKDTVNCLESVFQISYSNYDVVVVDNNSDDDSLQKIREYAAGKIKVESDYFKYNYGNKPIRIFEYSEENVSRVSENEYTDSPSNRRMVLIKNSKNYGFAKGNNIGIKWVLKNLNPEYIMLLNNDAIIDSECLTKLVNVAKSSPRLGIIAPKVLMMRDSQVIDSTGHIIRFGRIVDRGKNRIDHGQYDKKTNVIGAIAAACLYKREMLLDIGLFDESYFTCYEDAEMSWRAFKNGWKSRFVPGSVVYHKRGATLQKDITISNEMRILYLKNVSKTVRKYGTKFQRSIFILVWTKDTILNITRTITAGQKTKIKPYLENLREIL